MESLPDFLSKIGWVILCTQKTAAAVLHCLGRFCVIAPSRMNAALFRCNRRGRRINYEYCYVRIGAQPGIH